MGLDTSHNAWHGPYSSFGNFRKKLAAHIGIDLLNMEGFGGTGEWDLIEDDAKILLSHSDCDGEILPDDCKKLATRLREILPTLPEKDKTGFYSLYELTETFAKGCELAASKKESIEFH